MLKKLKSKVFLNMTHFKALCMRYISLIYADKIAFFSLVFQAPIMLIVILMACSTHFEVLFFAQMTMFVISVISVIMATLNSYREICKEREVLIRESNIGLDSTAYVLSKVFVQGIICLFQTIVIVVGTSLYFDFGVTGFFPYVRYFFFTYLVLLSSTCIGLFISALLKSSDTAILPVLFIIIAQVVLSGAIIDLPSGTAWLSSITITRWAMAGYGRIFNFQGYPDALVPGMGLKPIFTATLLESTIVLIVICIVAIFMSVLAVKRLRKKKN